VVDEIRSRLDAKLTLPDGYYLEYGGQFESEAQASRTIWILSVVSLALIAMILFQEFKNPRDVVFALVNLPLALIGGIWAVWLTDGIVSVASLVGFITLFGIAVRNGILLISHYNKLQIEGKPIYEAVRQGSMERLNPILMTALTAAFALIPLANGLGQPGKEIEAPMAIVILGGLITSTFLNMLVIPALYLKFSQSSGDRPLAEKIG
jgi:Cu(I)/Ag(I) efflux system membrane protein CusA/SilA